MCRILFVLAVVALWISGEFAGHTQPQDKELEEQLGKHGITLQPSTPFDPLHKDLNKETTLADAIFGKGADLSKAADLLRRVKALTGLHLHLGEDKLTDEHLKLVRELPAVKHLGISADQLSEQEIQKITAMKQLESLTLESLEFSDAHLRPLQAMKGMKQVSLVCAKASSKALADLKKALVQAKSINVERVPAIVYFPQLKISPDDSALTKLKKEKVNAVLMALRHNDQMIRGGKGTFGDPFMLELSRNLKDAILDLSDPGMQIKVIDVYVDLLEKAEGQMRRGLEAGVVNPLQFHLVRYYYLDAQILELRLKKQLEAK